MCGITGYIGFKDSLKAAFSNLKKLEYRGYDSAGVVFFDSSGLRVVKAVGKLENLQSAICNLQSALNTAAIAHTRWATHGAPTKSNAHPHIDCSGQVLLVHNGIIENHRELKAKLVKAGHNFRTETDTEIAAHLIEEKLKKEPDFYKAFQAALKEIRGAYAFLVINKQEPGKIYIARLGSPMVVGIGEGEFYIASDPTALAGLARRVMYLKDGQSGFITIDGYVIGPKQPKIEKLELTAEEAKKGKHPYFMLKEIYEIPEVVRAAMLGRLLPERQITKLGGLDMSYKKLRGIKRLAIVGCGTSYYAGMIGKLLFEELADMPTETAIASEFRYNVTPLRRDTAWLFISQSGETADTLAALRRVNAKRFLTLGLVNVVGSTIARETKAGVYNRAGAEIGVASTKAFLSQLTILTLMALYLARNKSGETVKQLIQELDKIPDKIRQVLKQSEQIRELAIKYQHFNNFLYLGRGYNYPTALEGALKIKELAYVHAEGYPSGEMKHGPIALIDSEFPTIAIVTKNRLYDKSLSNIEEIKARGGRVLAIATRGDKTLSKIADDVIYVPRVMEPLEPMVNVIPLQLLAYHFAVQRGYDVDKPRNLAKSVTVE